MLKRGSDVDRLTLCVHRHRIVLYVTILFEERKWIKALQSQKRWSRCLLAIFSQKEQNKRLTENKIFLGTLQRKKIVTPNHDYEVEHIFQDRTINRTWFDLTL
jgi:hypothetical protein